jgi:fatty-acyl-CoA synthase
MRHVQTSDHFIQTFPSDPDTLSTLNDIQTLELIPEEERFPCNSPNEALATVAHHHGDDIALTFLPTGSLADTPQCWTYTQYREEVIAAANVFHSLGLQPDESVIFLLPSIPEMLFGIWGAQAVGIAAPINLFLEPQQISDIAREANARILVTMGSSDPAGEDFLNKALLVQKNTPSIKHIIAVGKACMPIDRSVINWQEALAALPRDHFIVEREINGSEVAAYFHTGGTTGTPKLAQHTHRAEVVNVCQMALTAKKQDQESIPQRNVIVSGLPLFHVNAVLVSALTAIMGGGHLILAGPEGFREKQLIKDFWGIVDRYKVSYFAGVPTVYAALLAQDSGPFDISSLVCCGCGAAPMPVSMLREFRHRTGADIMEGYGMTETTVCATTHYYYGARNIGSIGMRLPYHQIRTVILDANGGVVRDCNIDEIGIILHSGPNVILRYKQDVANSGAWPEPGWLNSGDMGRVDAEGYVWLTGRAKDLIIRGGHNIDPLITEDALTLHPDVAMAAAVGKPDAYAGELPIAYVQLCLGATVTASELVAFARKHAGERAAAPTEVIILDKLPATAVGKTFKPDLRKDAIARAYREAAREAWPEGHLSVQVVDDNVHGLKVIIEGKLVQSAEPDSAGTNDAEIVHRAIACKVDQLAFSWKLNWRVVAELEQ